MHMDIRKKTPSPTVILSEQLASAFWPANHSKASLH